MTNGNPEAVEAAGRRGLRKAGWRLLPLLGLGYLVAYMDRINISFAALQMNHDLRFDATVYGIGGGLFFLTYALFEVPSNMLLMRFGARRWIARIMVTWGVIAMAMMFVRTPTQFYIMRLLLGAAEAGFFPGVIFYLMNWFPNHERGGAISRFYIALPASSIVMGLVVGPLLGLGGRLGLAGWQWLFLVEGAPAVLLGIAILFLLPDGPATAPWLNETERSWILERLAVDRVAGGAVDHGVLGALRDPRIWLLGAVNICVLGVAYAFNLSAPTVLKGATHWDAGSVGLLVAVVGVLGAGGMITAGWLADRWPRRRLHAAAYLVAAAGGYALLSLFLAPAVVIAAYVVIMISQAALQTVFWTIPGESLHGRSAAGGVAALGSIGMIGAAFGPYAWGFARDHTGSFQAGFIALASFSLFGAGLLILIARAHAGRPGVAPQAALGEPISAPAD